MEVVFLRSFIQDFKAIPDPAVRRKVERTVKQLQAAKTLRDLRQVKKLEGFTSAYRLRIGDHRIGFFLEGSTIELARIADRKTIYKLFP
ncbi:MAG: type II toxin-antitoxin system RelE family toxin [Flavobacteriales bacterium]